MSTMSAKVTSIGLKGLEGYFVQVEVPVVEVMESIVVVGLPVASVKESKELVSAALRSLAISLLGMKMVINLSLPSRSRTVRCSIWRLQSGFLRAVISSRRRFQRTPVLSLLCYWMGGGSG
jgi:magnesium chelatase family protein